MVYINKKPSAFRRWSMMKKLNMNLDIKALRWYMCIYLFTIIPDVTALDHKFLINIENVNVKENTGESWEDFSSTDSQIPSLNETCESRTTAEECAVGDVGRRHVVHGSVLH